MGTVTIYHDIVTYATIYASAIKELDIKMCSRIDRKLRHAHT